MHPPVARMLVKIITLLGTDNLNKSVKDHLIKVLRENPNIDKKDEVMTYIYALESDEFAKTVAENREKISQVDELIVRCAIKSTRRGAAATSVNIAGCLAHTKPANVSKLSLN